MDNNSASYPENSTKNGSATAADSPVKGNEPSIIINTGAEALDDERDIGPALYPPILVDMEVLGYINDKNGISYPRTIGRSTCIHHEVYYIFGDTVCKDESGNYVGTTSNTIAYVEDRGKCLDSEYREILNNGKVKALVPLDDQEILFEAENQGARIAFRMFGGAVDIDLYSVVWFQYVIEHAEGGEEYRGVGIANLTTYADGEIIVQRPKGLLFGKDEPSVGSFSTLYYQGWVYLWSHRVGGQIILARVRRLDTQCCDKYEYWDGTDWAPHWQDAQPVLFNVEHGAIVHTPLFGKDKPFLFVGANQQEDNMVQIGAAERLEGPFDLTPICKATGINHDEKPKYCMYPHIFASNIPKRELVITWSEHPPGGVIAAKLKFQVDMYGAIEAAHERKIAAEAEAQARELARLGEEQEEKERREKYAYVFEHFEKAKISDE